MNPYYINILLLIIMSYFFLIKRNDLHSKKVFCTIASFNWIILSGLRHLSIGADTYQYKLSFINACKTSWKDVFNNFIEVYSGITDGKDPGYLFFEKVCSIFTHNYQVYLIIIALIFMGLLAYFIYKNSSNPFLSYLLFSTLFYAFFAITGHRQTIATALTVLLGYELIKKRKLCLYILVIIISYTIHKSSIIFLPFYFIYNKKITKNYIIFMLMSIIFSFSYRFQLSEFFKQLAGYEEYGVYEGAGTEVFTFFLLLMFLVALYFYPILKKRNINANHYINALFLACFFVPLTYINPSAMRVVQYFSIFIMLALPDIVNCFKKQDKQFILYLVVIILLFLFIKGQPVYLFFWQ